MTTASAKLAEYGISMELAHGWLMANLASPAGILAVCANFGVTNAMLGEIAGWPGGAFAASDVKAFFQAHGLNSVTLDPANGTATVSSVSSGSSAEGNGVTHTVFLASATTEDTLIPFSLSFGTTAAADFQYTYWSNDVVVQGNSLRVPAGVQVFNYQVAYADDTADEPNESYSLTVGGKNATGTINDNDEPAPSQGLSVLLPSYLDNFAPVLDLNDRTGELSNASLRAKVMANVAIQANYWHLFNPARFEGSADGVFTPAELGVSHLGTIAATQENIESLFFGTYFDIVQSIDQSETAAISQFFIANLLGIVQRNPTVMAQYVDLFVQAEADPASPQTLPDSYYINMVTIGLQGMAASQSQTNVFETLISI